MFNKKKIRQLLEARVNEARNPTRGRQRFVAEIWETLGLCTTSVGQRGEIAVMESRDEFGRPFLAKGHAQPEEFSLKELGQAIMGDESFDRVFNPNGGADMVTLLEAGPGIDPTAFLNINTFTLAVSGLVEAKIIERFQNPAFIGDELVEVVPTKLNGQKMIGLGGIGDKGQSRLPGQPHARAQFGEQWIETPELDEKALAVEVLQETVFYDLTGQVLDMAGSVGDELGYRREIEIIDLNIGVTNSFKYNGTTYDTYQTASPWINSHVNAMQDYTDIDNSLQLFASMTDPTTGKEILVMPDTLIVQPTREFNTKNIIRSTEVRNTTNTNTVTISPNPIDKNFRVLSSPILYNRCIAANGLNLSAANAKDRWWMQQAKKAFRWMEAWPLRVRQASASEYVMLDRGLIAAYFANWRGVGAVREPRYTVVNANA